MREFGLSSFLIIPIVTTVQAETLEEAIKIAKNREMHILVPNSDEDATTGWIPNSDQGELVFIRPTSVRVDFQEIIIQKLAAWIDIQFPNDPDNEVQRDLRMFADELEKMSIADVTKLMDRAPVKRYVNIFQDDKGRYISDHDHPTVIQAYDAADIPVGPGGKYIETVEIISQHKVEG